MQSKTQNQKKQVTYTNDNVLESVRGLGGAVTKATVDAASRVGSDVLASLLGTKPKSGGELHQDEPVTLSAEKPATVRPTMQREFVRPAMRVEDIQLKQRLDAVRAELKALASSIKSLQTEVQKAMIEQPVEPGVYHVNFFTRLRSMLALLRQQIDDSRTWLTLSTTRRKQKKGYWGMLKKHGTSFGMSHERAIATQAG